MTPSRLAISLADLDVEADELAVGVVIGEGRIGAFRADAEHAVRLDRFEALPGKREGDGQRLDGAGQEKGFQPVHRFCPRLGGATAAVRGRNLANRGLEREVNNSCRRPPCGIFVYNSGVGEGGWPLPPQTGTRPLCPSGRSP